MEVHHRHGRPKNARREEIHRENRSRDRNQARLGYGRERAEGEDDRQDRAHGREGQGPGHHRRGVVVVGLLYGTARGVGYSARSAPAGSTRAARRAGIQLASAEIATNASAAVPSVTGSVASTPNRNDSRKRARGRGAGPRRR